MILFYVIYLGPCICIVVVAKHITDVVVKLKIGVIGIVNIS